MDKTRQLLIQSKIDCADYMMDLIFMMLDTAHEFGWEECAASLDQSALHLARESQLYSQMHLDTSTLGD